MMTIALTTRGNLMNRGSYAALSFSVAIGCLSASAVWADETMGSKDVVLRAMVDEVDRAMADLIIEGLPSPYLIQVNGQERRSWSIRAAYGGLVSSDDSRSRFAYVRTRVGSYVLDNSNIPRSFGVPGLLPLEDDYIAIRHALWLLLDQDYKSAVEILTRKEAYLKGKAEEERPDDYTKGKPIVVTAPSVSFEFDTSEWERRMVQLSLRFGRHGKIQNSGVALRVGHSTEWIVTSDGTRLRKEDSGLFLTIQAQVQADDGMRLTDSRTYLAEHVEQMASIETIEADIDLMCGQLVALSRASVLEQYTGPVLFEPKAAGVVFSSLLAGGLGARPIPLGSGSDRSFEKKLGLRVLPRSFRAFDDPSTDMFEGTLLAGAYDYDDEATPATRVELIGKGKLLNMVASRAPTKKTKKTTGHGRSGGFSDASATIGCLYVEDEDAVSRQELHEELVEAAKDEGLPYALRVESLGRGSGSLGNPLYAYKVDVETGKEELVRGMRFLGVQARSMKRILAAGTVRAVYNNMGSIGSSVIAPAVVFEELELSKIESEFDRPPILLPPNKRK